MTSRLLLVRHGETVANVQRLVSGHNDVPLTHRGRREAVALSRRLRGEPIVAAYASDLKRASETAVLALRGRNLDVAVDPRLRELCFGEWEGLHFDAVTARWPDALSRLAALDGDFCAPGGEPLAMTWTRVVEAATEIAGRHPGETALVAAHGGTVQILLAHALGLPLANLFRLSIANCSVSIVQFEGERPRVTLVNDCSHLRRFSRGRS